LLDAQATGDRPINLLPPPAWAPIDPELLAAIAAAEAQTAGGVAAHKLQKNEQLSQLGVDVSGMLVRLAGPDGAHLEANAQILEDRAFEVLEVLTPKKLGQAEAAFDAWFVDVEAKALGGQKLEALEHLTMLHVLKQGLFEKQPALEPYIPRLEAAIMASDAKLLGKTRSLDRIKSERMPRSYWTQQSKDAQKIHAAVFATKDHSLTAMLGDLAKNYVPGKADPVIAVGILASLFTGTGAHLLAGAVHGYLLATLIEHAIHDKIGHASPKSLEKLEKILSRFGPIGRAISEAMKDTAYSHGTIHHGSYGGSYVDRFAPRDASLPTEEKDAQRAKKKSMIDKLAETRGAKFVTEVMKSDYGRKLAHAVQSALYTAPAAAIVSLFTAVVGNQLGLDLGPLFVAASVATSLIFIPASNSLHPYLHMTKEEAFEKAGPVMRAFLESGYVSHIAQAHYLHHRHAGVNHNLVAGADFALGYEPTQVDAIVALRKMKTFY
jgi:hypothetical protein